MKKILGGKHSKDSAYKDENMDWHAFSQSGSRDVEMWKPGRYIFFSKKLLPSVDKLQNMDSWIWHMHLISLKREQIVKKHDQKMKELKAKAKAESKPQPTQPGPEFNMNIDMQRQLLNP